MFTFLARNHRWIVGALIAFWIAMFIGTHLPRVPLTLERVSDKTLHFTAFLGLSVLLAMTVATHGPLTRRSFALLLAVLAAYAAIDEILQIPVGRQCDLQDWYADLSGSVVGLTVFALIQTLLRRNQPLQHTEL